MPRLLRLDAELVRRSLAADKTHARQLIESGLVTINAQPAPNVATMVATSADIVVKLDPAHTTYVSRGGYKLAGAIDTFSAHGLVIAGRTCLDAGAATGGFTDVLLQAGAARVVAADVGYGELAWSLRNDPRVTVLERTHVKELTTSIVDGPVDLVVADLSFISLQSVICHLIGVCAETGDVVVMVKPQFELPAQLVPAGGVVRAPELHQQAVHDTIAAATACGWGVQGVVASQLPGPAGNLEFFTWFRRGPSSLSKDQVATAMRTSAPVSPAN